MAGSEISIQNAFVGNEHWHFIFALEDLSHFAGITRKCQPGVDLPRISCTYYTICKTIIINSWNMYISLFIVAFFAEALEFDEQSCLTQRENHIESCHPYESNLHFKRKLEILPCDDLQYLTISGSIEQSYSCTADRLVLHLEKSNETNTKTFCGEFSTFLSVSDNLSLITYHR